MPFHGQLKVKGLSLEGCAWLCTAYVDWLEVVCRMRPELIRLETIYHAPADGDGIDPRLEGGYRILVSLPLAGLAC